MGFLHKMGLWTSEFSVTNMVHYTLYQVCYSNEIMSQKHELSRKPTQNVVLLKPNKKLYFSVKQFKLYKQLLYKTFGISAQIGIMNERIFRYKYGSFYTVPGVLQWQTFFVSYEISCIQNEDNTLANPIESSFSKTTFYCKQIQIH